MSPFNKLRTSAFLLATSALAGCAFDAASSSSEAGTNEASFAVTEVPDGVRCIEVRVSGASTVDTRINTSPGSDSSFSVPGINNGRHYIEADAYDCACGAIDAKKAPSWKVDRLTVEVTPVMDPIRLVFHPITSQDFVADFQTTIVQVVAGNDETYALAQDGRVFVWGKDDPNPAEVAGLSDVRQLALGHDHTCAVFHDDTLKCWGNNSYGQLGLGHTSAHPSVPSTPILSDVKTVAAGSYFTCALKNDDKLWCFGRNSNGQLGLGDTNHRFSPECVNPSDFTRFVEASAGSSFMCAVTSTGRAKCWGRGSVGQLGIGNTADIHTYSSYSVSQAGSGTLSAVWKLPSAQGHTTAGAILGNGEVYAWGYNYYGHAGQDRSDSSILEAHQIPSLSDVQELAFGSWHGCALRDNGRVYCWGKGDQLGDGSGSMTHVPQRVLDLEDVVQITARYGHSCALDQDGAVWCWGENDRGQLGDGSFRNAFFPVRVNL